MNLASKNPDSNPKIFFEEFLVTSNQNIPVICILYISDILEVPMEMVLSYLKFSEDEIVKRTQRGDLLTLEESKLILGIFGIFKEVEAISNSPARLPSFNLGRWLGHWIREAVPALGGAQPSTYLSTIEGQEIVKNLLVCAASGAYR